MRKYIVKIFFQSLITCSALFIIFSVVYEKGLNKIESDSLKQVEKYKKTDYHEIFEDEHILLMQELNPKKGYYKQIKFTGSLLYFSINILLITGFSFLTLVIGIKLGKLRILGKRFLKKAIINLINVIKAIPRILLIVLIIVQLFGLKELGDAFLFSKICRMIFIYLVITCFDWVETAEVVHQKSSDWLKKSFCLNSLNFGYTKKEVFEYQLKPLLKPVLISSFMNRLVSFILIESTLGFLNSGTPKDLSLGSYIGNYFRSFLNNAGSKDYFDYLPEIFIPLCIFLCIIVTVSNLRNYFIDKSLEL